MQNIYHGIPYFELYEIYDIIKDCNDMILPELLYFNDIFLTNYHNRDSYYNIVKEYNIMEQDQLRIAQGKGLADVLFTTPFYNENVIGILKEIVSVEIISLL
jgi:uncharacterized Fe-S radical SAM superfamily protein PflX